MKMSRCAIALCIAAPCLAAQAQYRDDMPPVRTPPPAAVPAALPDAAGDFAMEYQRAGRPRVALFWNHALSARTRLSVQERTIARETGRSSRQGSRRETEGEAGKALLEDGGDSFDRTKTETKFRHVVEEPQRAIGLEERHAVMLQRGFVAEMNRAGLRFVDRAMAMRTTAATQHRAGADPQLIEAQALLGAADLLMEVMWIEDPQAPAGYGFDVRVKELRSGQELASVYSRGYVPVRAAARGRWVAGKEGYEFMPPPLPPAPGPAEVGAAVSHDVMRALGAALPALHR